MASLKEAGNRYCMGAGVSYNSPDAHSVADIHHQTVTDTLKNMLVGSAVWAARPAGETLVQIQPD